MADDISVSDIGILLGAFQAATLAGCFRLGPWPGLVPLAAAACGGLLMGYGARLGFGCNIGSFFSGIASMILHGWEWLVFAMLGTGGGIVLRRGIGLPA